MSPFTISGLLLNELKGVTVSRHFQEGACLIEHGQEIESIPLLITGRVAVYSVDVNTGNELYLYTILPDETCSLTLGSCLFKQNSQIKAIAETDITAKIITYAQLAFWLEKYPEFREFIFTSINARFFNLIQVIEGLAFQTMADRLYAFLKGRAIDQHSRLITMTHDQIAQSLGTARVVVSRLLKRMELDGKVLLFRNQVKFMDEL